MASKSILIGQMCTCQKQNLGNSDVDPKKSKLQFCPMSSVIGVIACMAAHKCKKRLCRFFQNENQWTKLLICIRIRLILVQKMNVGCN